MYIKYFIKVIFGAIIILISHHLFNFLFTHSELNIENIFLRFFSNFLIAILLGFYIQHSTLKGLVLTISLFTIYFTIGYFNILVEAYIFNVTDRNETLKQILQGMFIAFFFTSTFVYILNKHQETYPLKRNWYSLLNWSWKIIIGVLLYLILYLLAGGILQAMYPNLMNFYKDKIPPINVMILTQFPRGLIFVLISILIIQTIQISRIKKAVFVGLIFSILGGVAPLIIPNDFMPSNIRLAHGVEVGISNYIYGFILVYLIENKNKSYV